jgi:hypothetical protein
MTPRRIASYNIAWSSSEAADRTVGWGIKEKGWAGFRRDVLDPKRAAHPTVPIWLHCIGGALPNETFQFTQWLAAKRAGLTWLTDGFVETMRPLAHSGGGLTIYLGAEAGDKILARYTSIKNKRAVIADAMKPVTDTCAALGMDASADIPRDSLVLEAMKRHQDKGNDVFLEPCRLAEREDLARFKACFTEWWADHPDRVKWNQVESEHENVLLTWKPLTPERVGAAFARGYSVAGDVG